MPYDILVKEAEDLTEDQIMQVIAFARFLKYDSRKSGEDMRPSDDQTGWKRKPGILEGKIWLAEDFDETPEGFEEYM